MVCLLSSLFFSLCLELNAGDGGPNEVVTEKVPLEPVKAVGVIKSTLFTLNIGTDSFVVHQQVVKFTCSNFRTSMITR